jgi:hypothetical protein
MFFSRQSASHRKIIGADCPINNPLRFCRAAFQSASHPIHQQSHLPKAKKP